MPAPIVFNQQPLGFTSGRARAASIARHYRALKEEIGSTRKAKRYNIIRDMAVGVRSAMQTSQFVIDQNIEHYRRLLATASDERARGMLLKLLADEEKKQQEQQRTAGRPETIGATAREFHGLPQLGATDRKSWKPPHCELCGGVMKFVRRVSPPDAQVAISLYRCEGCGHTVSLPEQEEA